MSAEPHGRRMERRLVASVEKLENPCPHEQTPASRDHYRLHLHSDGCNRLCLPLQRLHAATSVSIRHRMGRIRPTHRDHLWSISAPRPQLGSLAYSRLDCFPCDPECLPHVVRTSNPHSVLRCDRLVPLPSHGDSLFSRFQQNDEFDTPAWPTSIMKRSSLVVGNHDVAIVDA